MPPILPMSSWIAVYGTASTQGTIDVMALDVEEALLGKCGRDTSRLALNVKHQSFCNAWALIASLMHNYIDGPMCPQHSTCTIRH